jgi:hypothetical protein
MRFGDDSTKVALPHNAENIEQPSVGNTGAQAVGPDDFSPTQILFERLRTKTPDAKSNRGKHLDTMATGSLEKILARDRHARRTAKAQLKASLDKAHLLEDTCRSTQEDLDRANATIKSLREVVADYDHNKFRVNMETTKVVRIDNEAAKVMRTDASATMLDTPMNTQHADVPATAAVPTPSQETIVPGPSQDAINTVQKEITQLKSNIIHDQEVSLMREKALENQITVLAAKLSLEKAINQRLENDHTTLAESHARQRSEISALNSNRFALNAELRERDRQIDLLRSEAASDKKLQALFLESQKCTNAALHSKLARRQDEILEYVAEAAESEALHIRAEQRALQLERELEMCKQDALEREAILRETVAEAQDLHRRLQLQQQQQQRGGSPSPPRTPTQEQCGSPASMGSPAPDVPPRRASSGRGGELGLRRAIEERDRALAVIHAQFRELQHRASEADKRAAGLAARLKKKKSRRAVSEGGNLVRQSIICVPPSVRYMSVGGASSIDGGEAGGGAPSVNDASNIDDGANYTIVPSSAGSDGEQHRQPKFRDEVWRPRSRHGMVERHGLATPPPEAPVLSRVLGEWGASARDEREGERGVSAQSNRSFWGGLAAKKRGSWGPGGLLKKLKEKRASSAP